MPENNPITGGVSDDDNPSIILIDDESLALRRLRDLLRAQNYGVDAEFSNALAALDYLADHSVDIAFVDLRMPGLSGLDLISRLNEIENAPTVVVTTAWLEHALDAYGPLTVAYLLKPVTPEALAQALNKVKLHLRQRQGTAGDAVSAELERLGNTVLVASEGKRVHRIRAAEISFFKAENKYVCAYAKDQQHYWLNESLNQLVGHLKPLFIRVHRNAAVNRLEVDSLRRSDRAGDRGLGFRLNIGIRRHQEEIEVSRSHHQEVRALFRSLETQER